MGRWRIRARDERGTILVFTALAMTVLIGSTAMAVDIGQQASNNRTLQSVADVIALDTARVINGQTVAQLQSSAAAAAQASALRNNFPSANLTVDLGSKIGSAAFVRQDPTINPTAIPNAARIIASRSVSFAFRPGSKNSSRTAVAVYGATADFSLGSFLVGTSGAQDSVLNGIFGSAFKAQVLSYSGLASANVSLAAIGLNMPVTALSPTQLLSTSVSAKDLMLASAAALNNGSNVAAVSVLNALAASVTATTMVNLGDTMHIETGGEDAAAAASVNVLQMLTAAAFAVDGTHAITIPAAQVNIPGLGGVTIDLDVITPAQTVFGASVGASVSNTQVNLTITPQIHVTTSQNVNACSLRSVLGSLLSLNLTEILTCGVLNLGVVNKLVSLDLNASIPISLSAAGASATLTNIACTTPQSITLTPTLNPLTVNANVDMTFTGTLLGNSLGNVLQVRASAGAKAQSTPAAQVFLNPSQFNVPRTVSSGPIGLAGLTNLTTSNVTLLNANLGPVLSVLGAAAVIPVNAALGLLDSTLISPLNHLLGLAIGGADLTALGMRCNQLQLVE
jgi:uncharacterized membrane protein